MLKKNKVLQLNVLLRVPFFLFKILLSKFKIILKKSFILSYYKVHNNATVNSIGVSLKAKIGKNSWIGERVKVYPGFEIGAYSCINSDALLESGTIGNFCSIAANVAIGAGEHPLHYLSTSVTTYENSSFGLINEDKKIKQIKTPPVIGHDVWIARDAIILRGVSIGNGAVIGANAVVTKDVPPYSIVAGVPAKVINYRFDNDTIARIEESNWWDNEGFYNTAFKNNENKVEELLKSL